MAQVVLGEHEHLESALRRFKRKVSSAGIFADMKKKSGILKLLRKSASGKKLRDVGREDVFVGRASPLWPMSASTPVIAEAPTSQANSESCRWGFCV